MSNEYVAALTEELRTHGVHEWFVDETGKHNKLRFRWNDRSMMYVFPKTPSDSKRGVLNALSDLRRSLGVRRVIRKVEAREQRQRSPEKAHKEQLVITVKPDPFAILATIKEPEVYKCPRMTLAEMAAMLNSGPRLTV